MRKLLYSLLLTYILISCSKYPQTPPISTGNYCRLKDVRNENNKKISSYEYSTDNKINKIINFDTTTGNVQAYALFDYGEKLIVKNTYYSNDLLKYSEYYTLNDSSWASSKITGTGINSDTTYFEYDSHGYLIKSINKISSDTYGTLNYTYDEGKRTLITSGSTPHSIDSIKYEYYDFKIPQNIKALLYNKYEIFGDPIDEEIFLGKNTDLALKSRIIRYTDDDFHIVDYEYSYEFDSNNNLTKIKGTFGYKNIFVIHSFEMNFQVECQ